MDDEWWKRLKAKTTIFNAACEPYLVQLCKMLVNMGAKIMLCDPHRVNVICFVKHHKLRDLRMSSPDIRAGVVLLIAAMLAEGTSNIYQIGCGYQFIDHRLNALGAKIERI